MSYSEKTTLIVFIICPIAIA